MSKTLRWGVLLTTLGGLMLLILPRLLTNTTFTTLILIFAFFLSVIAIGVYQIWKDKPRFRNYLIVIIVMGLLMLLMPLFNKF